MAGRRGDSPPLWTADEVQTITGGSWLRRPGPGWNPTIVRSTLVSDILPGWRQSGIVLVTGERRLARWFAAERELDREPAGCIVVEAALAGSPSLPRGRAILVVEDAKDALRALAVAARARHEGRVVAVAGNVGRTPTRAMTAHLLGSHGQVATNFANGNLRAHVFEQMASVRPETPYAVYELTLAGPPVAARDVSAVLKPDAVLLTGIDVAEPESPRPDARLALARRMLQLAESMAPEGTVVVNRDAVVLDDIRASLDARRIVSYGRDDQADYRLVRVEDADGVSRVHAGAPGRELHFAVPAGFMAVNGLGAVATAMSVGADVDTAAERLASFTAVPGLARPLRLTVGGAVVTVIDDSHDATPVTMKATLGLLGEAQPGAGGRRIAVLGDVGGTGNGVAAVYPGLAEPIDRHDVARVYTLGRGIEHLHRALPDDVRAGHFETHEALVEALAADLRGGDVVAVKASAPARFGRIVTMLLELDESAPSEAPARARPRTRAVELPPSRLLLDGDTGETLFTEQADRPHDPASLVKMMTLYLVFEELQAGRLRLEDELVASARAARQPGSRLGLAEGQSLALHDAILGLATVSANDVAIVVAEHLTDGADVPAFVERMNARAAQFGLDDTTFRTPSGIFTPRQTATAADMGRLGFRLYSDFPGYRQWLAHPSVVFDGWRRPATNSLLTGYQGLNGIKTGTVSSGAFRHLVGSAARGGRCFIGVVMGCRDVRHRDEEMTRLLDRGFAEERVADA